MADEVNRGKDKGWRRSTDSKKKTETETGRSISKKERKKEREKDTLLFCVFIWRHNTCGQGLNRTQTPNWQKKRRR